MTKKKEQRSNKWAFLIYQDSVPENYLDILEELHIPYVLSPWHDKDVNKSTGEIKKAHKHGALFFETLKSYSQVSDLLKDKLNSPAHVEVVMSPKGMYDISHMRKILISHPTILRILNQVVALNSINLSQNKQQMNFSMTSLI